MELLSSGVDMRTGSLQEEAIPALFPDLSMYISIGRRTVSEGHGHHLGVVSACKILLAICGIFNNELFKGASPLTRLSLLPNSIRSNRKLLTTV
jgi:hypothetical protein